MRRKFFVFIFLGLITFSVTSQINKELTKKAIFKHDSDSQQVLVYFDEDLFTSYRYEDTYYKPVLYPILGVNQIDVTRGFPVNPRPGERSDHPHHVGHWLNYGNVNGVDFWNHSDAVPKEQKKNFGSVFHTDLSIDELAGILHTSSHWKDYNDKTLIKEHTQFKFFQIGNTRIIDRTTILKAEEDISLKDNKEGFVAIRVRRELEHPSDSPGQFLDANGNFTEVPVLDNTGVTGKYLSSEGIEGKEVWGKRAKWIRLSGVVESSKVSIIIIDHPDNLGYPTYWHARGYGLFAANPLGQEVFSNGQEVLNAKLKKNEILTFKYRILIHSGEPPPPGQINYYVDFYRLKWNQLVWLVFVFFRLIL